MATYIIVSIIAYLLGSISFSVIFSKKLAGFDVREKGSGNAGTTNVLRTVGKKAAALTLLCDCLKGVFAVLVAFIAGKIVKDTDSSLVIFAGACQSYLLGICININGINKICIIRLNSCCNTIPSTNSIHS